MTKRLTNNATEEQGPEQEKAREGRTGQGIETRPFLWSAAAREGRQHEPKEQEGKRIKKKKRTGGRQGKEIEQRR